MLSCNFDRDHIGIALLHLKGEETAGGTNFQNALTGKIEFAEVIIHSSAQIPIPPLYHSMTGQFHGVVEVAIGDIFDLQGLSKNLLITHTLRKPKSGFSVFISSPLPLLQGERIEVRGCRTLQNSKIENPHPALSLEKGEAERICRRKYKRIVTLMRSAIFR